MQSDSIPKSQVQYKAQKFQDIGDWRPVAWIKYTEPQFYDKGQSCDSIKRSLVLEVGVIDNLKGGWFEGLLGFTKNSRNFVR